MLQTVEMQDLGPAANQRSSAGECLFREGDLGAPFIIFLRRIFLVAVYEACQDCLLSFLLE